MTTSPLVHAGILHIEYVRIPKILFAVEDKNVNYLTGTRANNAAF